jgi:hypothetical protein
MESASSQRRLANEQIEQFHHDLFVETQLEHFVELCVPHLAGRPGVVLDMGGGCGFFSAALQNRTGLSSRVVDADPVSVAKAQEIGVDARVGDALRPDPAGDESTVCFNLILHHLVAATDEQTRALQTAALSGWAGSDIRIFVNEYIYESYLKNASGRLIFEITASRVLSAIGKLVARVVPSLNANTFGVGVRFREAADWVTLFEQAGWRVLATKRGVEEEISLPRRMLMIKSCRRDSFVLAPGNATTIPRV